MTDQQRLEDLFLAEHHCISVQTFEEDEAVTLVRHAALEQRREMWVWTVTGGLRDGLIANSAPLADTEHPAAALYVMAQSNSPMTAVMLDLASHLKDERTLRTAREAIDAFNRRGGQLVLIDHIDLPPVIRSQATPFDMALPDDKELDRVVRETLRQRNEVSRIHVKLDRRELQTIIRNLRGLTVRQAKQVVLDAVCADSQFTAEDINQILAAKRRHLQREALLEYIEAPVTLDDIGGLRRLKFWLEQRQGSFSDEAAKFGISPPRGVLMLGVQGAGKSLSAKAVASAWQRPLLRMDAGALYDRYIGESERRLREALGQAERMAPIVLWIDEIEKAFASAASQSADGGLSKRMFGHLLTWMQEHRAPVFLIATANDIEALPPELLRKGRFDEIFFMDLPAPDAREAIFKIHLRKRGRDPGQFDLNALVQASNGFSGAEIEQSVVAALHNAFALHEEVTTAHIERALAESPPLSVTMAERINALRDWARNRCVPAD